MANRRRVRGGGMTEKLYAANSVLGLKVVRRITPERGDAMVLEGKARRVYRDRRAGVSLFCGYQLLKSAERPPRESHASNAAFSSVELDALVGVFGESVTMGLTDAQRNEREKDGLIEMDFIEEVHCKLDVYRHVH